MYKGDGNAKIEQLNSTPLSSSDNSNPDSIMVRCDFESYFQGKISEKIEKGQF